MSSPSPFAPGRGLGSRAPFLGRARTALLGMGWALTAATLAVVNAGGCGTKAVGVDDCRDLEWARCEASAPCGDIEDVNACKRFYRDHCAHGLPLTEEPASTDVEACRLAIVAAGNCAQKHGADVDVTECSALHLGPSSDPGVEKACDVVRHPERISACSFVGATEDAGTSSDEDAGHEVVIDAGDPDAAGDAGDEAETGSAPEE